ncbi:hypothetical protein TNCV_3111051 [Trichonephila clavipes]|nr:hypothetical protein TNCV_3111051 [Trichonephila clavipes]
MLITFFDARGVINKEFVPSGQTITERRLRRLVERFRTDSSQATRWLLVTYLVILNYSHVTRTTPELHPPTPSFLTTPKEGHLSIGIINVHPPALYGGY